MRYVALMKEWHGNPGISDEEAVRLEAEFGQCLPSDYIEFLKESDGGMEYIEDHYLDLRRAAELKSSMEYEVPNTCRM